MNRPLFELDSRLEKCAEMVRPGVKLADIGTDHGYLPIWLAKQNKIASAIAADINEGPLEKADWNVRRYHAEDKVCTRISDGLEKIFPQEADDIVMAGMGGELIATLISGAPWLRETGNMPKHLILQPMTSVEELRLYLEQERWQVLREEAVCSGKHVYTVMLAAYQPGKKPQNELFRYIGLHKGETEQSREYLKKTAVSLGKRAQGLKISGKAEEAEALFQVIRHIENLCGKGESK